jgi:hypothetical protein
VRTLRLQTEKELPNVSNSWLFTYKWRIGRLDWSWLNFWIVQVTNVVTHGNDEETWRRLVPPLRT